MFPLQQLVLPESLQEIKQEWFTNTPNLQQIEIKGELTNIPLKSFEKCNKLTKIIVPLNETRVIYGNKIFNNQQHFNQSFCLPSTIEFINEEEVQQLTSFTIPSFVTSLDDNCFTGYHNIKELVLSETLTNIPLNCFERCYELTNITIPLILNNCLLQ